MIYYNFLSLLDLVYMQVLAAITTYPSTAHIVSEPLGVVLVISTWNYPFSMYHQIKFIDFFNHIYQINK